MFKTVSAPSGAAWRRPGTNGRPLGAAHFRPADARHGRRRWLTGGKKVPVVYDFLGQDAFLKSLDYPAPLGVAALFGKSSGAVDPLNLAAGGKGWLFVTRPTLNSYCSFSISRGK